MHATVLKLPNDAIEEVSTYFAEAWGNRTRIDYGSGMELNFLCWLSVRAAYDVVFLLIDLSEYALIVSELLKRATTKHSLFEYSGGMYDPYTMDAVSLM